MANIKVHEGTVITQSVEKIREGQLVIVKTGEHLQLATVSAQRGEEITVVNEDEGFSSIEKIKDLLRLVVTDGTRFAPLQNEDWKEILENKVLQSNSTIKYIVIERKIGEKTIRLARIYKPRVKLTKQTMEEFKRAFFYSLNFADHAMSDVQKENIFTQFWNTVTE